MTRHVDEMDARYYGVDVDGALAADDEPDAAQEEQHDIEGGMHIVAYIVILIGFVLAVGMAIGLVQVATQMGLAAG
jgi:hypothetical protein